MEPVLRINGTADSFQTRISRLFSATTYSIPVFTFSIKTCSRAVKSVDNRHFSILLSREFALVPWRPEETIAMKAQEWPRNAREGANAANLDKDTVARKIIDCRAVYGVGEIVVYVIERPHLLKAFLFRTSKKGSSLVPGVFPAVDLFVQTRTRTKTRRFMGYLNHVREKKIDLKTLPDGFFIRLNNMLEVSKKKHDDASRKATI
jgi:hypothetical protein